MARFFSAVMLVFAVPGVFAAETDRPSDAARAVFADPGNEVLVQAYYESLSPDADGFVVVEGDILLSRAELEDYVSERVNGKPRVARYRGELLVDRVDEQDNFYRDMAARRLTYAIVADSFTDDERSNVATKLRNAGEQWANVCFECGISFTEVADPAEAFFTVQKVRDGRYLAAAFFPAYPRSRRLLNVDESFFSTKLSQTGILRHELGHVLGYRHEQIRGIAGCAAEGGLWRPLTAYDPKSVMHYFCGGGGNIKLELSDADRKGHRALYLPPAEASQFTEPPAPAAVEFKSAALAAQRSPAEEAARAAFVARLPRLRSGDFYVVEGDIILAGVEIEDYLRAQTPSAPRAAMPNGELLVNQHDGRDDVHPVDRRTLRYRVETASFSTPERYKQVRDSFVRAAGDWNTACDDCGLMLEHASKYDKAEPGSAVHFTVREQDEGGAFIAAAFFPHDPASRRVVLVDPSYFTTTFDRVGVFRHEIGHILGYRHEHIRGVAGCYSENDQWRPLTPYDAKSVMHYFCGGGGSLKLDITNNDRLGHRDVYRKRAATSPALGELRIQLAGGEVSANAAYVLQLLEENDLLKKTEYSVGAKQNIDDILKTELNLPGVGSSMRGLARKLNKSVDWRNVQIGAKLWIPDVRFKSDPITYSFDLTDDRDRRRLESIQKNWEAVVQPEAKPTSYDPDFVKLTFQSYELQIPMTSEKELLRAQRVIATIYADNNANLKAGLVRSGKSETMFPFYSVNPVTSRLVNASDWWGETTGKDEQEIGKEGDLGQLINLLERGTPFCEDLCPEVVLIDNPIFPHPDVRAAVRGLGGGPPDPVSDSKQKFVHADFDKKVDHGTHLAGIIAARRNGFGLVGVDPDALITSLLWSDYIGTRFDDLAKYVLKRNEEPNIYIYVTASSWQYARLVRTEDRFDNTLAAMIRDAKPLWISAAGNEGAPVRPTTLHAPMNLGDLSTMLVVAACSPCGADARLLPESNFADPATPAREKIVHIAAPGKSVPSTVDHGRYAETDGTSQAAAFVGGLASLMVRTWPKLYRHPAKLRMRIMTTSRPVQSKEFAGSVAAGVVDAANALRDPRINWITFKATGKPEEAVEFKWVSDRLETKVAGSVHKPVYNTEDIVSMYRFEDGQWVLYLKTHPGPVDVFERVGPLTILNAGDVFAARIDGEKKSYGIAALQQLNRAEMGELKQ